MSRVLGNVSVVGKNTYRKLTVPATASISSLTFSTDYVKGVLLTVTSSVVIREVTIYTQVGDSNHIDANNRFALIVASGSTVINTYVGWQSSWNQSNYYNINNYTFSNLLNSTPLPQKLLLDLYLDKGTYEFYLDESFNIGYTPTQDNIKYILSTTASNFPYTDPNGIITIGTTSNTNKTRQGNIFFNWIVSDYDNVILEKGGLGIYNYLSDNQDNPLNISSNGQNVFSLSSKTYSTPLSSTISFVISPLTTNNSYVFKLGTTPTFSFNSLYTYNNDYIYMGTSAGNGNWVTYSQYANTFLRNNNIFLSSGTLSSYHGIWQFMNSVWTQSSTASFAKITYLPPVSNTNLLVCFLGIDVDARPSIAGGYWSRGDWYGRISTTYATASTTGTHVSAVNMTGINGQMSIYYGSSNIQGGYAHHRLPDVAKNISSFPLGIKTFTVFSLFSISGQNAYNNASQTEWVLTALDPQSSNITGTHSFKISYDSTYNLNIKMRGDIGEAIVKSSKSLILGNSYLLTAKLDKTLGPNNQITCRLKNLTTGENISFDIVASYANSNDFIISPLSLSWPSIGGEYRSSAWRSSDANIGAILYYNTILNDSDIQSVEDWITLQYGYLIDIGISGDKYYNFTGYDVATGNLSNKNYRIISLSGSTTKFAAIYGSYSWPGININII